MSNTNPPCPRCHRPTFGIAQWCPRDGDMLDYGPPVLVEAPALSNPCPVCNERIAGNRGHLKRHMQHHATIGAQCEMRLA